MLCLAVTRILPVHCYVGPPWSALSSGTTTLMGRNAFEFNETLAGGRLTPKKKPWSSESRDSEFRNS